MPSAARVSAAREDLPARSLSKRGGSYSRTAQSASALPVRCPPTMKIVILGAGQVGSTVAESLVSERNDITVVDLDPQRLRALEDRLDLRTVAGSGGHPSVLKQAGIEDADLLIAVTQSDDTNLVACLLAARLFNVPRRIARLRSTDYLTNQ